MLYEGTMKPPKLTAREAFENLDREIRRAFESAFNERALVYAWWVLMVFLAVCLVLSLFGVDLS